MWQLTNELIDLVRDWWRRDRIRVRPNDGQLLRLRPGAVLCFSGRTGEPRVSAEVLARGVVGHAPQAQVCYVCGTSRGQGELLVSHDDAGWPHIQWSAGGQPIALHVDDIEVFQAESA